MSRYATLAMRSSESIVKSMEVTGCKKRIPRFLDKVAWVAWFGASFSDNIERRLWICIFLGKSAIYTTPSVYFVLGELGLSDIVSNLEVGIVMN
jgi:hypothetical protein